ncbi:hypothetical protein [Solitalea koreensis]|uniref:Uncharacterized protein n=1 Tax=Solitalea koreensis TaxID=543615 RepID=A0A521CZD9_9SPHI|nr:hypothetical protein [Solitalea koreensis]SMO64803.1 hypothetical protein SAMN06265350_10555 [Solitalea koreensis]
MKKLFLLFVFACGMMVQANAQVSVNVSFGTPPMRRPVAHTQVRYYYLPDIYSYYDAFNGEFIYNDGRAWVRMSSLPRCYRDYNLNSAYKVVLEYNGDRPYAYYSSHSRSYPCRYQGPRQVSVREYSYNHCDDECKYYKKHKHHKDNDEREYYGYND